MTLSKALLALAAVVIALALGVCSLWAASSCNPSTFEVPAGSHIVRCDTSLALVSVGGQQYEYMFSAELIQSSEVRTRFNRVLNGLLFGCLYRLVDGKYVLQESELRGLLPNDEERRLFLQQLIALRGSPVLEDGHASAAFDILLLPFFQPAGAGMATEAILQDTLSCSSFQVPISSLTEYIILAPPTVRKAVRALGQCASEQDDFELEVFVAISLAQLGEARMATQGLDDLKSQIDGNETRAGLVGRAVEEIRKMPMDGQAFRCSVERVFFSL